MRWTTWVLGWVVVGWVTDSWCLWGLGLVYGLLGCEVLGCWLFYLSGVIRGTGIICVVIRIRVKSSDFHVISDHLCHGLKSTTSIRRFWSYNDFIIIHGVRCDHGTGVGYGFQSFG